MNKIEFKKLDKEQMIIAFNQLKDDYSNLFNENNQLKEVIEEAKEYVNTPWILADYETGEQIHKKKKELLQILDKAKGE